MRLIIQKNYDLLSEWAANYVAKKSTNTLQKRAILLFLDCQLVVRHWVCTDI
jgi:hypothetical protein